MVMSVMDAPAEGADSVHAAMNAQLRMFARHAQQDNGFIFPRWDGHQWENGCIHDQMPHFVLAYYYHIRNTGDRTFLAEVWPVLSRAMAYVLHADGMRMGADGVATTPCASGLPHANVADNWMDIVNFGGQDAIINSYLVTALSKMAEMADWMGGQYAVEAPTWASMHAKAAKAFNDRFLNESAGLYSDWIDTGGGRRNYFYLWQQFNAIDPASGLTTQTQAAAMIRKIDEYLASMRTRYNKTQDELWCTPTNLDAAHGTNWSGIAPWDGVVQNGVELGSQQYFGHYENGCCFMAMTGLEIAARGQAGDPDGAAVLVERALAWFNRTRFWGQHFDWCGGDHCDQPAAGFNAGDVLGNSIMVVYGAMHSLFGFRTDLSGVHVVGSPAKVLKEGANHRFTHLGKTVLLTVTGGKTVVSTAGGANDVSEHMPLKTDEEDGQTAGRYGPRDPRCLNESVAADIASTGFLNLWRFAGSHGDTVQDDAATLRSAIGCSNRVFLPSPPWSAMRAPDAHPGYLINSTIVLADQDRCPGCPGNSLVSQVAEIAGIGRHGAPSTQLLTRSLQPVFQVGDPGWKYSDGAKVILQDIDIRAVRVGVLVTTTSDVHLTRVAITVTEWATAVDVADHAALVVVNTYWLYISACNFVGATPPDFSTRNTSTRPSVILRGEAGPLCNSVYLVTITDTVFNMGGVQYQQRDPSFRTLPDAAAGWLQFSNVVQESSDTPLLDIVGLSAVDAEGNRATFAQISVNGYMSAVRPHNQFFQAHSDRAAGAGIGMRAWPWLICVRLVCCLQDAGLGWELSSKTGIVRFNLTAPGGVLHGVTISGAGDTPAGVVVMTGTVQNINVLQSAFAGVVDGAGIPVGPAVIGTAGGLSLTGLPRCEPGSAGCPRRNDLNDSKVCTYGCSIEHPLMIGHSGGPPTSFLRSSDRGAEHASNACLHCFGQ
eukprot:SAG22_NODE_551_length_9178_cov_3.565371_2_plen_939_part_00